MNIQDLTPGTLSRMTSGKKAAIISPPAYIFIYTYIHKYMNN